MEGFLDFLTMGIIGNVDRKQGQSRPATVDPPGGPSQPVRSPISPSPSPAPKETPKEMPIGEMRVDSANVQKGMVVCLATGYATKVRTTGSGHPHHSYLSQTGVVTAIGIDQKACIVVFREGKEEKMCIGRGGEFHLAVHESSQLVSPQDTLTLKGDEVSKAHEGNPPRRRRGSETRTVSRDEDGKGMPDRGVQEVLVRSDNVRKDVYVTLSRARSAEIAKQGPSHAQYSCLKSTGLIKAVGQDRQACIATFGDAEHKFFCGRNNEFHLALPSGEAPSADSASSVLCGITGVMWTCGDSGGVVAKRVDAEGKLRVGDVLLSVNTRIVHSPQDACAFVKETAGPEAVLQIRRFQGILGEVVDGNVSVSVVRRADVAHDDEHWEGVVAGERRVDWRVVCKGMRVVLLSSYAAEVRASGAAHVHHDCQDSFGTVTAVGLDSQACIARFGAKEYKFLIGRKKQFQLALVSSSRGGNEDKTNASKTVPTGAATPDKSAPEKSGLSTSSVGGSKPGNQSTDIIRANATALHEGQGKPSPSSELPRRDSNSGSQDGETEAYANRMRATKIVAVVSRSPMNNKPKRIPSSSSSSSTSSSSLSSAGHGDLTSSSSVDNLQQNSSSCQAHDSSTRRVLQAPALHGKCAPPHAAAATTPIASSSTATSTSGAKQTEKTEQYGTNESEMAHKDKQNPQKAAVPARNSKGSSKLDPQKVEDPAWVKQGNTKQDPEPPSAQRPGVGTVPFSAPAKGQPQTKGSSLGIHVEEDNFGVYIIGLIEGSPAASAAPLLKVNDRIVKMNGECVRSAADARRLAPGERGTIVQLECVRLLARTDISPKRRITTLLSLVRGVPGAHQIDLQVHEDADTSITPSTSVLNSPQISPLGAHVPSQAITQGLLKRFSPPPGKDEVALQAHGMRLSASASPEMASSPETLSSMLAAKTALRPSAVQKRILQGSQDSSSPDVPSAGAQNPTGMTHPDMSSRDLGGSQVLQQGHTALHSTHEKPRSAQSSPSSGAGKDCNTHAQHSMMQHAVSPPLTKSAPNEPVPDLVFDVPYNEIQIMLPPMGVGTCKTAYMATWRDSVVGALEMRGGDVRTEVLVLRRLPKHENLPAFYGVALGPDLRVFLVEEFFPLGGLDVQLEIWEGKLSTAVLLCLVQQVCAGMMEIHSHGVLHRDLAARNVLVKSLHAESVTECWVKVSDFGNACVGESADGLDTAAVPWRWSPPESHRDARWVRKSDVWAFGVCMWEVFSFAMIPYMEISSDDELRRRVFAEGLRLQSPLGCPAEIYAIMRRCWDDSHHARPTFQQLSEDLQHCAPVCCKLSPQKVSGQGMQQR